LPSLRSETGIGKVWALARHCLRSPCGAVLWPHLADPGSVAGVGVAVVAQVAVVVVDALAWLVGRDPNACGPRLAGVVVGCSVATADRIEHERAELGFDCTVSWALARIIRSAVLVGLAPVIAEARALTLELDTNPCRRRLARVAISLGITAAHGIKYLRARGGTFDAHSGEAASIAFAILGTETRLVVGAASLTASTTGAARARHAAGPRLAAHTTRAAGVTGVTARDAQDEQRDEK
jgi:hypothetical protein